MTDHISCSAALLFLHNPAAWHKKYVLGIKELQTTPAALTGSAMHRYLEMIFKGHKEEEAKATAITFLKSVSDVDWGKTGSVDKSLNELDKFIASFHANPPSIGKVLGVEQGSLTRIRGIQMPIKAYVDLIHEQDNQKKLVDWKTTRLLEDHLTPSHIFQACTYYFTETAATGIAPYSMTIFQIKASESKDGSPSTKALELVYEEHPEYLKGIKKLYQLIIKEMKRKRTVYLPNIRDDYEGEETFNRFLSTI